jgi:hypothetical protein
VTAGRNALDTELERRRSPSHRMAASKLRHAEGLKNTAPSGGNVTLIE